MGDAFAVALKVCFAPFGDTADRHQGNDVQACGIAVIRLVGAGAVHLGDIGAVRIHAVDQLVIVVIEIIAAGEFVIAGQLAETGLVGGIALVFQACGAGIAGDIFAIIHTLGGEAVGEFRVATGAVTGESEFLLQASGQAFDLRVAVLLYAADSPGLCGIHGIELHQVRFVGAVACLVCFRSIHAVRIFTVGKIVAVVVDLVAAEDFPGIGKTAGAVGIVLVDQAICIIVCTVAAGRFKGAFQGAETGFIVLVTFGHEAITAAWRDATRALSRTFFQGAIRQLGAAVGTGF